jgi:hypothetical protein
MIVEFSFSMGLGSIYYHFDLGQYSERKIIWVPFFLSVSYSFHVQFVPFKILIRHSFNDEEDCK